MRRASAVLAHGCMDACMHEVLSACMHALYVCARYHKLYLRCKGNQFKNKRVLIEAIHNEKNLRVKEKALQEQVEARKQKAAAQKEKRRLKDEQKREAAPAAAKPVQ